MINNTTKLNRMLGRRIVAPAMALMASTLPAGTAAANGKFFPEKGSSFNIEIRVNPGSNRGRHDDQFETHPQQRRNRPVQTRNRGRNNEHYEQNSQDGYYRVPEVNRNCDLPSWAYHNPSQFVETQQDCTGIQHPYRLKNYLLNNLQHQEIDYCNRTNGQNCPPPRALKKIWYGIKHYLNNNNNNY